MKTKFFLFVTVVLLVLLPMQVMAYVPRESAPDYLGNPTWQSRGGGPQVSTSRVIAMFKAYGCSTTAPCFGAMVIPPSNSPGVPPGDVFPVSISETLYYIGLVLKGDPNTFIMRSPTDNWMLAWYSKANTWSFIGLSKTGQPFNSIANFLGANKVNTFSFSEFVKALEKSGWQYKSPQDLPAKLVGLLQTAANWTRTVSAVAMPLPIMFMIPLQQLEVFKYLNYQPIKN